jgi:hypothetical protein
MVSRAKDDGVRVFQDGNCMCAVFPDFINLQESPAGFGNTEEEAVKDLYENEEKYNG